jgi:Ca2+-binding RTX toxin-like protein
MAVVLVATPVAFAATQAMPAEAGSVPNCHDRPATMVVSAQSPYSVRGTDHRDVIVVTGGSHSIWAAHGDDVVCGNGYADIIHGGGGNDRIYGGRGADKLYGGHGEDVLFGGRGDDYIRGGPGNDRLTGGRGTDILDGARGDDALVTDDADQVLLGQEDDETYAPPG